MAVCASLVVAVAYCSGSECCNATHLFDVYPKETLLSSSLGAVSKAFEIWGPAAVRMAARVGTSALVGRIANAPLALRARLRRRGPCQTSESEA